MRDSRRGVFDQAALPQVLPVTDDDSVHGAAHVGDTNASGSYNAPDATLLQRQTIQLTDAFPAYPLADTVLLADIAAKGLLQANDAIGGLDLVLSLDASRFTPRNMRLGSLLAPPAGLERLHRSFDERQTSSAAVVARHSPRSSETIRAANPEAQHQRGQHHRSSPAFRKLDVALSRRCPLLASRQRSSENLAAALSRSI